MILSYNKKKTKLTKICFVNLSQKSSKKSQNNNRDALQSHKKVLEKIGHPVHIYLSKFNSKLYKYVRKAENKKIL